MSASRLRTVSQVWPPWLPGALTGVEHHLSTPQTALPSLIFSASFNSLSTTSPNTPPSVPRPNPSMRRTRPNRLSRPAASLANINTIPSSFICQQPEYGQQIRVYSRLSSSNHSGRKQQGQSFTTTSHCRLAQQTQISPSESQDSSPSTSLSTPSEAWTPPSSTKQKPITILGAGVLGRRLAVLWASKSRPVKIYEPTPSALKSARTHVADSLANTCFSQGTHPGHVTFTSKLDDAVQDAWMVIECAPEDRDLKTSLLAKVDGLVEKDIIIATSSAGFRSGELVGEVLWRERVLNMLFYVPPKSKAVEMMSSGYTSPNIIPFLAEELKDMGLKPVVVKDSVANGSVHNGMIFPRIRAAMKKEALKVLSEGVAEPKDVDMLFKDFFGAEKGPCEMMDEVGLDTVVRSERSRLPSLREGDGFWGARGEEYVDWLDREFVKRGKLGAKTGEGLIVKKRRNTQVKKVKDNVAGRQVRREHSVELSGL